MTGLDDTHRLLKELKSSLAELKFEYINDLKCSVKTTLRNKSARPYIKDRVSNTKAGMILKDLLLSCGRGTEEEKTLSKAINKIFISEHENRVKKANKIIKKSCIIKKLVMLETLKFSKKTRPEGVHQDYKNQTSINKELSIYLSSLSITDLEKAMLYKPYTSTIFKETKFDYYIKKHKLLSHIHYIPPESSITATDLLRIQIEINPKSIHSCVTQAYEAYQIIEKGFNEFKKEVKKINKALININKKNHKDLEIYINGLSNNKEKNISAYIAAHAKKALILKNINKIKNRIRQQEFRKKTNTSRKNIYFYIFQSSHFKREELSSTEINKILESFFSLERKNINKIIQTKKTKDFIKSPKKHQITIPLTLAKKIKSIAKSNKISEEMAINIALDDDNDKFQFLTEKPTDLTEGKISPAPKDSERSYEGISEEAATNESTATTAPTYICKKSPVKINVSSRGGASSSLAIKALTEALKNNNSD